MYLELAILAVIVMAWSGIAGAVERTAISGPMVFTVVGLVIGPIGLGWLVIDLDLDHIDFYDEQPGKLEWYLEKSSLR